MKGPGYKQSGDVRRTWKCPECGAERKQIGDITTLKCVAHNCDVYMKLIQEKIVAPRPFQSMVEKEIKPSEFQIDDLPVLLPHPSSIPAPRTAPKKSYSDYAGPGAGPEPESEDGDQTVSEEIPKPQSESNGVDDWGEGILE